MKRGKAVFPEKKLKKLEPDTKLPYVFDLYWDAKIGKDLDKMKGCPEVRRHLAQYGFDANGWQASPTPEEN